MVEEGHDDGAYGAHEEDAEGREVLAVEELEHNAEDDGDGVAVEQRNEQAVEDVPRHLLGDGLHDAASSQGVVSQ